jgi:hypothetical protein
MARKKKAFSGKMGESGEVTFQDLLEKVPTTHCDRTKKQGHAHGDCWAWNFELFVELIGVASTMEELDQITQHTSVAILHAIQHTDPKVGETYDEHARGLRWENDHLALFVENKRQELLPAGLEKASAEVKNLRERIEQSDRKIAEAMAQAVAASREGAQLRLELRDADRKRIKLANKMGQHTGASYTPQTPDHVAIHYSQVNDGASQILEWYSHAAARLAGAGITPDLEALARLPIEKKNFAPRPVVV